jgi:hypothetical protein
MGEDGSRGAGMLTAHPDRPNQSHRPERSTAVCSDLSVGVLVLSVVHRAVAAQARPGLEAPRAWEVPSIRAHRGLVMQLNGAVTEAVAR